MIATAPRTLRYLRIAGSYEVASAGADYHDVIKVGTVAKIGTRWTATTPGGVVVGAEYRTRDAAATALAEVAAMRPAPLPVDAPVEHISAEGDRVEWIDAEDAVLVSAPSLTGSSTVRPLGGDDSLGRVYPAEGGTGFVALPTTHECDTCLSVGSTLCDEDGVSTVFATRGDAARAIFAHLRELEVEAEVDDECESCGEPRDLGDDGQLLPCGTCQEAEYARQEAETARIEALCSAAATAHEHLQATRGRGKAAARRARFAALDALRVAALPDDATNADALDLALGGTTVAAIEHRLGQVRAARLAEELGDGVVVRFRPGAMPSCDGLTFLVEGEVREDNSRGGRLWVWLRDAADSSRGRSAYVDALELAVTAEASR